MSNICINTLNAEGTPGQVDELLRKLSDSFGGSFDINDDFATEEKGYATLTLTSKWKMPQKELLEATTSLTDTQGLYIRVTAEEPAEEYFEQAIFSDSKWTFENLPAINTQIHALTTQGIEQIRRHIKENGNTDFGEGCTWVALYINNDGYAECPYFQRIESEADGKLSVLLSDGHWLYEDELTTVHVMDLLTLLFEGHGKDTE
jgi:hypothetical protein